jgi:nicotinamidase-related amidase
VTRDHRGRRIAAENTQLVETLLEYDAVVVAGQAKSHCLAWTIEDLLGDIRERDPELARKVYLLEDCTSPVVIPGAVDFTEEADRAFARFAEAGVHVVRSTDSVADWAGF